MRLTFALIYLIVLNIILFREPLPFSAGILALDLAESLRDHRSFAWRCVPVSIPYLGGTAAWHVYC